MLDIYNQPLANLTSKQIAQGGNVQPRTARWLRSTYRQKTIHELRVQSCHDCGRTLVVHDTLSWLVQIHRSRCDDCAARVRKQNPDYDTFESYFVA